ncbi:hypothetical protein AB0B15_34150 [Streptomyces sp. NPDC045456]|uniref:glycosyl hydrolase family 95 catalytic domain-containing protein n=1 Tax=Streptomyces sp. NPDC045456 TaxID=3155254 RepID=UPI0033C52EFD
MNAGFGRRSFLRTSAGVAVASGGTLAARPPGVSGSTGAGVADPYESAVRDARMEWAAAPEDRHTAPFLGDRRLAVSVYCADGGRALRFALTGPGGPRVRQTAGLDLVPAGHLTGLRCTLDLWDAELTGTLTTTRGRIFFTAFVAHGSGALWVRTAAQESESAAEFASKGERPNAKAVWAQRRTAGRTTAVAAMLGGSPAEADATVRKALAAGPDTALAEHRTWWHAFYRRSFVSLQDRTRQRFHWAQMYAAASLTDPAACDLAGAPALLGPAHHLGTGMVAKALHGSAAIPGHNHLVTALPGVGSKAGRAVNPVLAAGTPLLWDVHRHTDDAQILRELLLPTLRRTVDFCAGFLTEGTDGRLHLPLTHSPGQADVVDCTYDLALFRWAATTLVRVTRQLGSDTARLGTWRDIATRLAPYHCDATGVMLGQGRALTRSDPDAAHLLWLWPLGEKSWSRPGDRAIMRRSYDHWAGMREAWHAGSYAVAASLAVAVHDPRQALDHLDHLMGRGRYGTSTASEESVLLPNTLYRHIDSPGSVAPFAAGRAQLDLLVKEEEGVIDVFSAASGPGADACVAGLRVPGAFVVDAARHDGRTRWVRVRSQADRVLRLRHRVPGEVRVLTGAPGDERPVRATSREPGTLTLRLAAGESVTVLPRGADPGCEVGEVPAGGNGRRWGGG